MDGRKLRPQDQDFSKKISRPRLFQKIFKTKTENSGLEPISTFRGQASRGFGWRLDACNGDVREKYGCKGLLQTGLCHICL